MNRIESKLFLFIFLLFANCQSTQKNIERPPDVSRALEILEKDEMLPFPVKQELTSALKQSQEYSNSCYVNLSVLREEFGKKLDIIENLELQIVTLEKIHEREISDLEKEIATWRKIKFWFWTLIISLAVGFLVKLFWPLIRKGLGFPI